MADNETFDDELFADLYNDDEPAPKGESASAPAPASIAAATTKTEAREEEPKQEENGNPAYGQNSDEYEYEEDDDEVDFNIGGNSANMANVQPEEGEENSTSYNAPLPPPAPMRAAHSKEDGKMFIGGLNWETTDESLRNYFSKFGEVVECTVMRDGATGRSRGFGFLTFKDAKTVNVVMVKEHHLDGKIIDPKRAIPREEQEKTSKIFVGGVSQDTTDHEFREYFAQFGRVVDATLMMDKDTGRPRGFGFVTFESEAGVDACLSTDLAIHGKPIEVKKAQPRGNMREEEEAARRGGGGKFGRKGQNGGMGGGMDDGSGNGNSGGGAGNAMAGMGATAGMSPQFMAQYLQRMQQAFAAMQQQMMSQRNAAMTPAMWQMMQVQQMQAMQAQMMAAGRGTMNPAMAQQMQQHMQQQQQQMMMNQAGGMGQGGADGQSQNRGSYGGFDQGQFDQQRAGSYGGGMGGGGGAMQQGGGGGGAPTSWEGMYDDVPQPQQNFNRGGFRGRGVHQQGPVDPAHAPPANAPTGPKNAGRPGSNMYRGGGRGASRGYHPYGRG